jgi:hypothetical protein
MKGKKRQPRPPKREKRTKKIRVFKLWTHSKWPKWPQVAVLLLSVDEYRKYLAAPEEYVNGQRIFAPSKTHKIVGYDYAPIPKSQTKAPASSQYMVVLKHELTTTSSGMSSSV